ncbi:hypothetical protein EV421DRAFT_1906303 [Armillaria borealis]|uniref:NAD(P)-binding protein n=1 Tax=Armillaria borealis TaxID=47425 RepID=A0AA39JA31_9AGAR|nr:hypothetical protein EV421DRAFT_1906303 [Armillaria borealis]
MADLNMATAMSLSGRVGLVTGGGTGIGFMIVKAFAANGAKVSQDPLSCKQMDVTDEESVKAGVKHIEGIDGKLDILVNNAGIAGPLHDPDFTAKKFAATDPFEPETVAYLMTKSALNKLTLVLGASFAQRGIPIRVNVLAPGAFASQLISPEVLEAIKMKPLPGLVAPIPAKRQGTEVEMGMTAVYLAVSDYTNGVVLSIDGGVSLVNP